MIDALQVTALVISLAAVILGIGMLINVMLDYAAGRYHSKKADPVMVRCKHCGKIFESESGLMVRSRELCVKLCSWECYLAFGSVRKLNV